MSSYAVRHLPEDLGDVTTLYKKIKKIPFSYTSKAFEAEMASNNNYIYVIQREKIGRETFYKLAYRYRCSAFHKAAGNGKWLGQFDFKNTVKYGEDSELEILDPPIAITNEDFNSWYKTQTLGMCEIPIEQENLLSILLK